MKQHPSVFRGRRAPAPRRAFAAAMLLLLGGTRGAVAQQVPIAEHGLSNGLRVLLVERHDDPSVAAAWVAHVGSANERPGITGIAHLFEHMMFKGTPTIGTTNYTRDLEIMAAQERVREEMRAEEAGMRAAFRRGELADLLKPENKSARYRALEAEFARLVQAQRDVLVKNEFDRVYKAAGGAGMNAFTSHDMTAYFVTVPANKLELCLWMESERLGRPVFREFYAERDVVFEERRMRTEATPLGKFHESLLAMFWEAHPYHWPVIGWPSDLPTISKATADEFYATYYAPQNITLILAGDFQPAPALALVERYFGRIPRGPRPAPEVLTIEVPGVAEKRLLAEAEANPQVDILWQTVPFAHKDSYALTVLGRILSSRTGRLYKGLVLGSKVATDAEASQDSMKWAGLFSASGEAAEGHTPDEVEQGIYREIEKLQREEVPAEELQKVKNNLAAGEYRRLSSNMAIAMQILHADGLGDWREVNAAGPKLQAVTAADIRRVAAAYLVREHRTVGSFLRKGGGAVAGEDPALSDLNAEQKTAVRQMTAWLKTAGDPAHIKASLARLEQTAAQASADMKPVFEIVKRKMLARIAELESPR